MGFQDTIRRDNHAVFLNTAEFAHLRDVVYDEVAYTGIPLVMTGAKQQERPRLDADRVEGLYHVTSIVHVAQSDIGGLQPKQNMIIRISDDVGSMRRYTVASSVVEEGMVRLELEGMDE